MKLKESYPKFLKYLEQKGYANKSLKGYEFMLYGSLSHSIQDIELKDLKLTDVVKVLEAGRSHGAFGPQRSVSNLRCLLRFLEESGEPVPFNWRLIQVPSMPHKPIEYLTDLEMEELRTHFDLTTFSGKRFRVLIELLRDTGLRIGEALAINREHIDWSAREIKVINNKTKEHEKVYFTERVKELILNHLKERNDNILYLFVQGDDRHRLGMALIKHDIVNFDKQLQAAGFKKHVHFHIFRKTFATKLIQSGANIKETQYLCRHKSERTTLRSYTAVDKERVKITYAKIFDNVG